MRNRSKLFKGQLEDKEWKLHWALLGAALFHPPLPQVPDLYPSVSQAEQQHSEVSAEIPETAPGESAMPLKAWAIPSGWVLVHKLGTPEALKGTSLQCLCEKFRCFLWEACFNWLLNADASQVPKRGRPDCRLWQQNGWSLQAGICSIVFVLHTHGEFHNYSSYKPYLSFAGIIRKRRNQATAVTVYCFSLWKAAIIKPSQLCMVLYIAVFSCKS